MALTGMVHDEDPREKLLNEVGTWIDDIDIFHNQILLAIYDRSKHALKTKSGIYISQRTAGEDEHQGKVGLVIKKGPLAFVDDDTVKFHGQNVEIGDWIGLRPSDGWPLKINDTICRMVRDVDVRARARTPDCIY